LEAAASGTPPLGGWEKTIRNSWKNIPNPLIRGLHTSRLLMLRGEDALGRFYWGIHCCTID